MRAVIQRVLQAEVKVEGQQIGEIDKGLLVYLSVGKEDTVKDAEGAILLVSNFTLHGDCRKGRRPGFDAAAEPALAQQLYEKVIDLIAGCGISVENGAFGEYMQVSSTNDGPVTFLLDSGRLF